MCFSLKTGKLEIAKAFAAHLNEKLEHAFFAIRIGLPFENIQVLLKPFIKASEAQSKVDKKKNLLSSVLFDKFHKEMCETGRWNPKTRYENRKCFDLFLKIAGDKPVPEVNHQNLLDFRDILCRLPPNMMKYADDMFQTGAARLFPNLRKHKKNGYAHQVGQFFHYFNRANITTNRLKTFHSIRHTVTDTLKQLAIAPQIIAEIMGHSTGSITMNRYGKRFQPHILLEAISKLDYEK